MAFSNTSGSVIQTKYVLPTVEAHNLFKVGQISPKEVEVNGSVFTYKTKNTATVSDGTRGRALDQNEVEFTRKDVNLINSLGLQALMSGASVEANDEDALGMLVVEETMNLMYEFNSKGIAALEAKATEITSDELTGANVYEKIVDAKTAFIKRNAKTGTRPTVIYVSPEAYAALLKSNNFQLKLSDTSMYTGVVGTIAGLDVIEVVNPMTVDFIMGCPKSLLAPLDASRAGQIIDKVPGRVNAVVFQNEIPYAFEVLSADYVTVYKH